MEKHRLTQKLRI